MTWHDLAILLTFFCSPLASLQCLPFGITAMPSPRPLITVYSIGWSDVPDYAEHLLGFVFDLEQVGRDADSKARRWDVLGGCNGDLDRELEEMWPLAALAELINNTCSVH